MADPIEIVDTGALPWEAWYPQYEGTKCKTLFDNADTGESLRLAFVPSEFRLAAHTRHHHGPTREFVYVLFGDLPYVEYHSPQADPRPFTFREGMLLDRPPRSIHGMSNDPVSSLGSLVLEWTTGPNDFNSVPFDDTSAFEGQTFNDPWVADVREVAWTDHPTVAGWRTKVLASGGDEPVPGYHPVSVVHIPGTWEPEAGSATGALDGSGSPWLYVLDGSGSVAIDAGGERRSVDLAPGTWVRWTGGSASLEISSGWTTDIGLTLLCAGNRLVADLA